MLEIIEIFMYIFIVDYKINSYLSPNACVFEQKMTSTEGSFSSAYVKLRARVINMDEVRDRGGLKR